MRLTQPPWPNSEVQSYHLFRLSPLSLCMLEFGEVVPEIPALHLHLLNTLKLSTIILEDLFPKLLSSIYFVELCTALCLQTFLPESRQIDFHQRRLYNDKEKTCHDPTLLSVYVLLERTAKNDIM